MESDPIDSDISLQGNIQNQWSLTPLIMRSEGLVLVTNNLREFERVPALQLENWVEKIWSRELIAPVNAARGITTSAQHKCYMHKQYEPKVLLEQS